MFSQEMHEEWADDKPLDEFSSGSSYEGTWVCPEGHTYHMRIRIRNVGTKCYVCSGKVAVAGINDLVTTHPELAALWHPDNDLPASEITANKRYAAKWIGPCGHEWDRPLHLAVKAKPRCPYCAPSNALPLAGFNDLATTHPSFAAEWHPDNELRATEVTAASGRKVKWLGACGHEWSATVGNRTSKNQGCPFCAPYNARTLSGVNDLATVHPNLAEEWSPQNDISPTIVSVHSGKRVAWVCKQGHEWFATVCGRVRGFGCPYCSGRFTTQGVNDLATVNPDLAAQWHPDNDKTPHEVQVSSRYRAKWICKQGHEWFSEVYSRSAGTGCPECWAKSFTSNAESEVADFVRSLGVDILTSNRSVLKGRELDIVVPERGVAIEYNGLYWHSTRFQGQNDHRDKTLAANDAGLQLIHVWEDDWRDRRPVVERMVARKLGASTESRVNARQLVTKNVSASESRQFLDATHIQGSVGGRVRLGLYDGNTLHSLMVFRHRKGDVWELARYATDAIVRGGFSKLFKAFLAQENPQQVVSFSDNGVSDGSLYESQGFVRDGEIPPDYMYLVGSQREHKFNYRKARFEKDPNLRFEQGLTERELAELNGLERIYDAGKVRWVWSNLC